MTSDEFRALALGFTHTKFVTVLGGIEFWINGAPFATLGSPDPTLALVRVSREDQAALIAAAPLVFSPAPGGAGQRGMTLVRLANTEKDQAESALQVAYAKAAGVGAARQSRPR